MAAVEFSTISDADLSAKRPHIRIGMLFFIWPVSTLASGRCTHRKRLMPVALDSLANVDI